MSTAIVWGMLVLAIGLIGFLVFQFLILNPIKKHRIEKVLAGFYECTLEEVVISCRAANIDFSSPNFRVLLNLRPDLVGHAYGSLLKAEGVADKPAKNDPAEVLPCRHDQHIIFLAEELANLGHCPFTKGFMEGMATRYPEYAAGLRKALIVADGELRKKRYQKAGKEKGDS